MSHLVKLLLFLTALFVPGFCNDLLLKTPKDALSNIDNYLFEQEIIDFLEKFRDILKNGDPDKGIPPLEPFPFRQNHFNFILEESRLKGYLGSLVVRNISDFNVTSVNFSLLQFKLTLSLHFPELTIDGGYSFEGNLFEEQINSTGTFVSQITGLDVDVVLHVASNFDRTVIEDFTVDFTFVNNDILYLDTVTEKSGFFDNSYLQPLAYRFKKEYFPLLENTLMLVVSDLIYDITIEDLLKIILGIIQGQGLELIATSFK